MVLFVLTESDYGYGNQYSTSYGANGAADGGGFVAGEPQSSPAAGRVSLDTYITGLALTTGAREAMEKIQCGP